MLKQILITTILLLILFSVTSYLILRSEESYRAEYSTINKKIINISDKKLIVEIADEPQEQSQGLSGRENLDQNEGMLFIFPTPAKPEFWMKEMKFALDIIWIDENGTIVGIEKNVSPDTFPKIFSPPSPIKYVLEVNADWSDLNNIKIGDITSF